MQSTEQDAIHRYVREILFHAETIEAQQGKLMVGCRVHLEDK